MEGKTKVNRGMPPYNSIGLPTNTGVEFMSERHS